MVAIGAVQDRPCATAAVIGVVCERDGTSSILHFEGTSLNGDSVYDVD